MSRRINTISMLAAVALSLFSFSAYSQSVPGSVELSWTLPTTGCRIGVTPCSNTPLTGADALTAIEVYIATAPIADTSTMQPTLTLAGSATTTTHTMQVAAGSTLHIRLKARNAHGVSAFTTQVTKVVTVPVIPGVPTNVTITLTITPAP